MKDLIGKTAWPKWFKYVSPFLRTRKSYDTDDKGETTEMQYKRLFGKVYVIGVYRYYLPPVHYNCRCAMPEGFDEETSDE